MIWSYSTAAGLQTHIRTAKQCDHRGAVRERSQGLSLRNPWIDSIDELHPGGMRETTTALTRSFSHPSGMRALSQCNQGFRRLNPWLRSSTPPASFDHCQMTKLQRAAKQINIWSTAACRRPPSTAPPDFTRISVPSSGRPLQRDGLERNRQGMRRLSARRQIPLLREHQKCPLHKEA